jgi:alpha,alpha-trehalose phosphorylase
MEAPLRSEDFFERDARVILAHSTRRSGLLIAAGMEHVVEGPDGTETRSESGPDVGRVTVATELASGERLRVVKFLAYGWSSQRSLPAVRDQVVAALSQARHTGWQGLADQQRAYLDEFWDYADVELEGDTELQQAVRFRALPHAAGRRARRGARDRGEGLDRPWLRRPRFLGHRTLCPPCAHLHRAESGR